MSTPCEGSICASPVAAERKIYIGNAAGKVAVIAAGREWRTLKVNDLRENCYATPALVDDLILMRSEHSLWAFRQDGKHLQDSRMP